MHRAHHNTYEPPVEVLVGVGFYNLNASPLIKVEGHSWLLLSLEHQNLHRVQHKVGLGKYLQRE